MKKYNYFDDDDQFDYNSQSLQSFLSKIKIKSKFLKKQIFSFSDKIDTEAVAVKELKELPNLRKRVLKICAFVIFIVVILICVGVFVNSINSINKKNEDFCTNAGKVCTEYISKYGACRWQALDQKYGKNFASMDGVSYSRRMDFNGDGKDELMICYLDTGVYYMDIWGYDKKSFKKVYSHAVNYVEKDRSLGSWITFYHTGNKYYVGESDPKKPTDVELLALKGNKFKKVSSCTYSTDTGVYTKGKKVNTKDFERVQLSFVRTARAEQIVDIVTDTLDEFHTKTTAEIEANLTDAQLKAQAYYNIVQQYNTKYGQAQYATDNGISYVKGLAVVDLIDFNGDGNKELLLIYRKDLKIRNKNSYSGEFVLVNTPQYCVDIYSWNKTIAKCVFSRSNISTMLTSYGEGSDSKFYILKNSGEKTDFCFNNYSYDSQSVYTAYSKIYRMDKDEKFASYFDARLEYKYGYKSYYLNSESVYSSTFEEKGYQVPYFCNLSNDYDNAIYSVHFLEGTSDKSDQIKAAVDSTVKIIKSLDSEYDAETNK